MLKSLSITAGRTDLKIESIRNTGDEKGMRRRTRRRREMLGRKKDET